MSLEFEAIVISAVIEEGCVPRGNVVAVDDDWTAAT